MYKNHTLSCKRATDKYSLAGIPEAERVVYLGTDLQIGMFECFQVLQCNGKTFPDPFPDPFHGETFAVGPIFDQFYRESTKIDLFHRKNFRGWTVF